ncbi:uncharacterized protein MELLADRAFT_59288 [Melampsora larici-populina 98AG31]|uniref:Uncharacterized protein n=1 Tax=Melampsora larici-populina (strain 98AG31 / pathotype 3-4-7) TaxID=747676 RepID=F4R5Q7_MELLP|nr:uncharacterized protein MELLADRAFT_59288 [Melampsora larici-populina 98AG31]EGG12089.1 hypothetical protein MELLADRAFT_59288 [Melampsora larici-populina 98AG31]
MVSTHTNRRYPRRYSNTRILSWNIPKGIFNSWRILSLITQYSTLVATQNDLIRQSAMTQRSHIEIDLNAIPAMEESEKSLMGANLAQTLDQIPNLELSDDRLPPKTGLVFSHSHSAFKPYTRSSTRTLSVQGEPMDENGAQTLRDQSVFLGECDESRLKPRTQTSQIPSSFVAQGCTGDLSNKCDLGRNSLPSSKNAIPTLVDAFKGALGDVEPNETRHPTNQASSPHAGIMVRKSSSVPSIEASLYLPQPHATNLHYLPHSHEPILTKDLRPSMMHQSKALASSQIRQGSKRKYMMPEKPMNTGEEVHSKKKNSMYQHGKYPNSLEINELRMVDTNSRISTKISPQASKFFRHQLRYEDLGLFDFKVESKYTSSMAQIFSPHVPKENIYFGETPKFPEFNTANKPTATPFRHSQKTLAIEEKLKKAYALQPSEIQSLFQMIRCYSDWIGDRYPQKFLELESYFGIPWKRYSESSLYLIGIYNPTVSRKSQRDPGYADNLEIVDDVYDRLRWMRQVQSAYEIPSSRQNLGEALVWGGYFLFSKDRTYGQAESWFNRLVSEWSTIQNPMSDVGPCPCTFTVKCMRDIAAMTENTWKTSKNFRDSINQIYQYSQKTGHGAEFWVQLPPRSSLASNDKLNWGNYFD